MAHEAVLILELSGDGIIVQKNIHYIGFMV